MLQVIDIKKILALIILLGFLCIILVLFFVNIPQGNMDLLKTFGIALISIVSGMAGYYFGSSEGSARKTEIMSSADDTPPSLPKVPADQSQAGFIHRRLLPLLLLVSMCFLVMLSACATTQPTPPSSLTDNIMHSTYTDPMALAGKSLLAVKSTIVTAATAVDAFCKAGKMTPDKCDQARNGYAMAQKSYDAAIDAYLLRVQGYGSPADFDAALARVQGIATIFLTLSGGAQ